MEGTQAPKKIDSCFKVTTTLAQILSDKTSPRAPKRSPRWSVTVTASHGQAFGPIAERSSSMASHFQPWLTLHTLQNDLKSAQIIPISIITHIPSHPMSLTGGGDGAPWGLLRPGTAH